MTSERKAARLERELAEARAELAALKGDPEATAEHCEPASDRRTMALALVAAVLAGTVTNVDEAKAQFGGLFGGAADLSGIFDIFLQVLRLGEGFDVPGSVIALIDQILGMLDGEHTTMRTGQVEAAIETSYPRMPILTPEAQAAGALLRAEGSRARVVQSQNIMARIAETQGSQALGEQALVASVASAGPYGLVVVLQAILAMQGSTNARLGQISTQLGMLGQLQVDRVMTAANESEQGIQAVDSYLGVAGATVAPTSLRPAQ